MREMKNVCTNYLIYINSIWVEFGIPLRLVSLVKSTLFVSRLINIQQRESYSNDFVAKDLMLACIRTPTYRFLSKLVCEPMCFKLGIIIIDTTKLYSIVSSSLNEQC